METMSLADPGEGPGGPTLPPLSLDQTEARRGGKKIFKGRAFLLSQGLDDQAPSVSEGLDPPLDVIGICEAPRKGNEKQARGRPWETWKRTISKKLKESNFLRALMAWSDQGLICR